MEPETRPSPVTDPSTSRSIPLPAAEHGEAKRGRFALPRRMTDRALLLTALLLGAGWLLFGVSAQSVSTLLAARYPNLISQMGGSKVPEMVPFVSARLHDAVSLATLAWVVAAALIYFTRYLERHSHRHSIFLTGGLGIFVLLNVAVYCAGSRALFWLALLGLGGGLQNNAQFRAKEILLNEVSIHPRLVLVGSSQSNAQIKEERFNRRVAGAAWMVELHFPGSLAEDVFYVTRRWDARQADAFVYYVSPLSFYSANYSAIGRDLFRFRDLPAAVQLGTWARFSPDLKRYVVLGATLPLFQYREALQRALLGATHADKALPETTSLHRDTSTIQADASSVHQKALFRQMLTRLGQQGQRIFIIGGQFNPNAQRQMAPGVQEEYEAFLKACAQENPHVSLVWQDELLIQPPEAYRDETHVLEETAQQFTDRFTDWYLSHSRQGGAKAVR